MIVFNASSKLFIGLVWLLQGNICMKAPQIDGVEQVVSSEDFFLSPIQWAIGDNELYHLYPIAIISIHITYYIIYITIMSPFDIPTMTISTIPSPVRVASDLQALKEEPKEPKVPSSVLTKERPGTAPQSEDPVVVWAGTELRCFWTCLNSFKGGALPIPNPKIDQIEDWSIIRSSTEVIF